MVMSAKIISKKAHVHNKLWFMNSPKGSFNEDVHIISIFILVLVKANYRPKIRLLAIIILEIATQKTLERNWEDDHNTIQTFS